MGDYFRCKKCREATDRCAKCAGRRRTYRREMRSRKLARGECADCSAKPERGKTRCKFHRLRNREMTAEYRGTDSVRDYVKANLEEG